MNSQRTSSGSYRRSPPGCVSRRSRTWRATPRTYSTALHWPGWSTTARRLAAVGLPKQLQRTAGRSTLEQFCSLLAGHNLASEARDQTVPQEAIVARGPVSLSRGAPLPETGFVGLDIAAIVLGVNRWTLREWARQQRMPVYCDKRLHRRFDLDELRVWVQAGKQKEPPRRSQAA